MRKSKSNRRKKSRSQPTGEITGVAVLIDEMEQCNRRALDILLDVMWDIDPSIKRPHPGWKLVEDLTALCTQMNSLAGRRRVRR